MAKIDRTRKILWAKSGNKCARCNNPLIVEKTKHDRESIVGDECHIHSKSPNNGPRYVPNLKIDFDHHDNLILLCKTCHKEVDDQPDTFTAAKLRELKLKHELHQVIISENDKSIDSGWAIVFRIDSGYKLVSILRGALGIFINRGELSSYQEVELIGPFFDWIEEFIDYLDEMPPSEIAKTELDLNAKISEIEDAGFVLLGRAIGATEKFPNKPHGLPMALLSLKRKSDFEVHE